MNLLRHIADRALSPTRSTAFFVICVSIAAGLYLAGLTDGRPNPASAKALNGLPVVKAELIGVQPAVAAARVDPAAMRPIVTTAIPSDRPTLVRRLQAGLARAGCYSGPISGVWNEPSQAAMQRFVAVANAQLPVAEPDPTLLALIESSVSASCGNATVTTGSIEAPRPVPVMIAEGPRPDDVLASTEKKIAAKTEAAPETSSPPIERSWAPAEMLVMPKEPSPADSASTANTPAANNQSNIIVGSSSPDRDDDAPLPVTASPAKSAAAEAPAAAVKDITAPAAPPRPLSEQKIEVQPDPTAAPDPRDEQSEIRPKKDKAKSDKTKTAKKKSKSGSPSSFSEGLDQLQRSVSNFFN